MTPPPLPAPSALRAFPVLALAAALLAGCGAGGSSAQAGAAAPASAAAPAAGPSPAGTSPRASAPATAGKGVYVDEATYRANPAAYTGGKVVLFFHAPWCPSCRANEKDIQAKVAAGSLPAGLTLVKVDYDSSTDLKARYGVTVQDTFVQVDAAGHPVGRPVTDPAGVDGLVAALA